jgi:hypothetical protein
MKPWKNNFLFFNKSINSMMFECPMENDKFMRPWKNNFLFFKKLINLMMFEYPMKNDKFMRPWKNYFLFVKKLINSMMSECPMKKLFSICQEINKFNDVWMSYEKIIFYLSRN